MKYKVEGCIIPDVDPCDKHWPTINGTVIVEPFSKWYDAENHLDAAGMFILEYPDVNCLTILVVDEDYNLGSYPLDHVKVNADYQCGLRWKE